VFLWPPKQKRINADRFKGVGQFVRQVLLVVDAARAQAETTGGDVAGLDLGVRLQRVNRVPAQIFAVLFGTGSLYAKDSGPYLSVLQTAQQLRDNGHRITVVGTRNSGGETLAAEWGGISAVPFSRLGPQSLHFAPALKSWLRNGGRFDVVSLQSVWLHSNCQIAAWCREKGTPYMITVHGNFNEVALRISKWKKALALNSFARDLLKNAACFQAICESEIKAMRAFGIRQPICLIPNGIEPLLSTDETPLTEVVAERFRRKRTCLYVGRLHPIKGLDLLLRAWAELKRAAQDWQLIIAGRGDSTYCRELQQMIEELGISESVHMIGPIFDQQKAAWLRLAELYVLPSHSEGLAMAPLEAMAEGVPALITTACNFPQAVEVGAAAAVACSVPGIREGLATLLAKRPHELRPMGAAGRAFVAQNHNWEQICAQLESVYAWMIGTHGPPSILHFG